MLQHIVWTFVWFTGSLIKIALINSSKTVGYLLEVFIRLRIRSMVNIFTSGWSYSAPKQESKNFQII